MKTHRGADKAESDVEYVRYLTYFPHSCIFISAEASSFIKNTKTLPMGSGEHPLSLMGAFFIKLYQAKGRISVLRLKEGHTLICLKLIHGCGDTQEETDKGCDEDDRLIGNKESSRRLKSECHTAECGLDDNNSLHQLHKALGKEDGEKHGNSNAKQEADKGKLQCIKNKEYDYKAEQSTKHTADKVNEPLVDLKSEDAEYNGKCKTYDKSDVKPDAFNTIGE